MADLSILIPARNEMFLARTIQDILTNMRGDTEVIAVLDGQWTEPPIEDNPKVRLIYHSVPIGQRAATNEAAKLSHAKYVMKCDAHCAFEQGFDVKMLADIQEDWTFVPIMRNLHAFDWVCPNGHRRYQGPSGACKECGEPTIMDVVWIAKHNPQSTSYCFDAEPHFQYFNDYRKRPEAKGDFTETMSLQGSCFMMTRERYLDLDVCCEDFGSWGSQGIEVAVKSWLSGGRVMVNHKTWYAHMFRTQGGDFGFPYSLSGKQVDHAKRTARNLFFENKWSKQVHSLSWLVERFWPVPGWTEADLSKIKKAGERFDAEHPAKVVQDRPVATVDIPDRPADSDIHRGDRRPVLSKAVVYYTDNRLDPAIMVACQTQLKKATDGLLVVSVSLKPLSVMNNLIMDLERGYLTMFKQILAGLEHLHEDIVFFAEHDVLYHPSHFDFIPPREDVFYYDQNTWKVDSKTGQALFYYCNQTLGLCAYRELLLEHYRKRVERVERDGYDRHIGFEPGTHSYPRGIDSYGWDKYMAAFPSIDIRHGLNLTKSRWSQDEFRNKKYCQGWKMSDEVPGWGVTKGRFDEIIRSVGRE